MRDRIDPSREELISLTDAARMIPAPNGQGRTVSVTTVRRWARDGTLQTVRAGDRIVLTSREEVWRMLRGEPSQDAPRSVPTTADDARARLEKAGVKTPKAPPPPKPAPKNVFITEGTQRSVDRHGRPVR